MAKTLCIDRKVAAAMKESVRKGEIKIADLYNMDSAGRRAVFQKFASPDLAQFINAEFEGAMVSKQKDALKKWAEKVFTPAQKKSYGYEAITKKIEQLEKLGVLNNKNSSQFLADLTAEKLGISVTPEEAKEISTRAAELEKLYDTPTGDGLPPVQYWTKRKEMEDYLQSITPNSQLRVATSVAGRGVMLLSIKSPLTNIISNSVQGFVQGMERRIASGTYKGLNGEFALDYVKKVNEIFQKSGFDLSRMESVSDNQVRLGEEITHSQGPGAIRAAGRWYEDVVFKQLMGAPDVAASSVAFADSVDLATTKLATANGLKGEDAKKYARMLFKDAIRIKPTTIEGEIVRSQAIADARYATYTNNGGYADLAMAIRSALNTATGDIRLGDQLMPFVKTPANVVQAAVESSGVGGFVGFYKLPEALRRLKEGDAAPMREVTRLFTRSGLGLTLAVILAYGLDPDDFIGDYEALDNKSRELGRIKNAPYNSVRIGGKWISLDYLGPLAAPFIGIMYARKYGDNLPEKIFQYGKGAGATFLRLPGLREFSDLVRGISDSISAGDPSKAVAGLTDEAVAYIRARTVPAIVQDFAKGIDPVIRETGKDEFARTKAGIPGVRQTLPPKINQLTGEPLKGEGFVSTLLFGNRLRTAETGPVVTEIDRLYSEDAGPTITEIDRYSKRVKDFKGQVDHATFTEAMQFYGNHYSDRVERLISTPSYKAMDDDRKRNAINKLRGSSMDMMLSKYRYRPTKKDA